MRILFMGTPEFAVEQLRRLVEDGHDICGVFTQPDKPKNRGMKMTFSPVKEYALSQGLAVYQPTKIRITPRPPLAGVCTPAAPPPSADDPCALQTGARPDARSRGKSTEP